MTKEEVQELISDRLWRLSLACADDRGAMKRLASILQRLDFEGRHGCHRAHPHEDMSAECEAKTEQARPPAPPPSEPYPEDATSVGDVVGYTSPTTTGYNGPSATMQVMAVEDVAERERAARQRGLGFALSVLGRRAKQCERSLGLSEVEVALRRAWEEINEEWREAQNP